MVRPSLSRFLSCSAWVVASTAATSVAHADAAPVRVHVDYHASAGCPDAAAFQEATLSRAPEIRFESDEGSAATWIVTVTRTGAGAKGELSIDGGATTRAIDGESCVSVVTALSVIAALAARDAAAAESPPPPPAPLLAATPPDEETATPAAPAPVPHWRPALGLAWLVQSSRGALGPSLFVGLERGSAQGLLAPAVRLQGARLLDGSFSEPSFSWWLVGLDACALRLGLTSAVAAHLPCLDFEGGSLGSSGFPSDQSRPWLATGVSARIGLALGRVLRLELTGAGLVPLTRDTFLGKPDVEAYRPDVILVRLAAGLGLTLP